MIEYSENVSSEETPQVTSSYEHFKVKMSDQLAKQFDEIKQTTGLSGAEVFSRAIALYSIAKKAIENGEQLILKGEDRERELFNF
jgi:metal-responsive CopG/Arc/MetJ family transcriptional regulator